MLGNESLISELQSRSLRERIENSLNAVDLNWLGFSKDKSLGDFDIYGNKMHFNRALLWFASKPLDYIRESYKGGILYDYVGRVTPDTDLSEWESDIQNSFNKEFANDLDLLYIKLNATGRDRLNIEAIVRDTISGKTFPINTGVTI